MSTKYPLSEFPNVKGVADGPDGELIVFVTKKRPESELNDWDVIPKTVTIDGEERPTDVREVMIPHGHGRGVTSHDASDHQQRIRPIPGGVSIGNSSIGYATVGSPCLYHHGDPVVLTNSHVTNGERTQYQPSAAHGDAEAFGTLREQSELDPSRTQTTDSALIDVDEAIVADQEVLGVGDLVGFTEAEFGVLHTKSGARTNVTTGKLVGTNAVIDVAYGEKTVTIEGCNVFTRMSAAGDSGSLNGPNPVSTDDGFEVSDVVFAGSPEATITVPIQAVMAYHGELSVEPPEEDDDSDEDGLTSDEIVAIVLVVIGLLVQRVVERVAEWLSNSGS